MQKKKIKQERKGTKVLVMLNARIAKLLEKFQGSYQAEFGQRITKEQVINMALEVYIDACYKLSKD